MKLLLILAMVLIASPALGEVCTASVYSTRSADQSGARTASGIPLNDAVPSVAHKTHSFRAKVRVTNLRNGQSGTFPVTDRGPYVHGRCIDLSLAAAILLGCKGLCPVKVEP